MKTQCLHCKKLFNAPDEYNGKKGKCPKCKQSFIIGKLPSDGNNKPDNFSEQNKSDSNLHQDNFLDDTFTDNQQKAADKSQRKRIHIGLIPAKFQLLIHNDEHILYASNPSW